MNPMEQKPLNMTRVIIESKEYNTLDFAFYKDGMYQIGKEWYQPSYFNGWLSIKELKSRII